MRSKRLLPPLLILVAACSTAAVHAQATSSRGDLLYTTHCVECHNTQMHWRDQRLVRDFDSLKAWVRHWQGEARLDWPEDDVEAVARHLNATIYHFPQQQAAQ